MTDPQTPASYASAPPRSVELYERARRVIPGGVSSPVRAYRAVGGTPRFIQRGVGQHVYDADGQRYLDFVGSWGPLILGHAHPEVVEAVTKAVSNGMTFGAPCQGEVELAERITSMYPGLEQVRFVSSGTEAVMSAIRLARAVTGRSRIVKFAGCYHGHADHLLVAAGSGLATFGRPSSAGVPEEFVNWTSVLSLDDEAALHELFSKEGDHIAAVIIEPVPGNHGLLLQRREYLQALREITQKHGALLIFDEVISGFRVGPGGAAQWLGITPDMATFGKIIGGGMPVGAFGASRKIMGRLAPDGDTYQAGTLSGNPVAMAAGLTTLNVLQREDAWTKLEALGAKLEETLQPVLAEAPLPVHFVRLGSMFWLSLHEGGAPRRGDALTPAASAKFAELFHMMMEQMVYLPPSAYEVLFLSLAHTEDDLQTLADTLREAFGALS
jgi:glutamate-1-semialdehyde 2,1-aminomutase